MRRLVRSVTARLPEGLPRRLAGNPFDRVRRLGATVSIVVVVDERDLHRWPVLISRLAANAPTEVVLAPVGNAVPPDLSLGSTRVTRVEATDDWRQAVAAGTAAARGRFVLLHRACDELAPDALPRLASAALSSAAAVALGDWCGHDDRWPARRRRPAAGAVAATTLARTPALVADLSVGAALWRRSVVPRDFGPDDDWLCSPAVAGALAGARVARVDGAVTTYAADHGWRAFGATPSVLPALPAMRRRFEAVADVLPASAREEWRRQVASVELPRLLVDAERASEPEWAAVVELARQWGDAAEGVGARALTWQALHGSRTGVAALATEILDDPEGPATLVGDGRVLADWRSADLPDDVRALSAAETALRPIVVRSGPPGLDIAVRIDHVDLDAAEIEVLSPAGATWVSDPAARDHDTALAAAARDLLRLPPGSETSELVVSARGLTRRAELSHQPPPAPESASVVRGLAISDDGLVVAGDGIDGLRLVDDAGVEVSRSDGGLIPLLRKDFGITRPLPSGPYRLLSPDGNVRCSDDLRVRLPLVLCSSTHRVTVRLGPAGGVVLGVRPPLPEDAIGPYAQRLLRAAYSVSEAAVDARLVYCESYAGRQVTDSPAAISAELVSRRPDLDVVWGLADHSVAAPAGTRGVLVGSPEWWSVLARAGLLVVNTDVEEWFTRRPGQHLVQTYHGHPAKAMGRSLWAAKSLRQGAIAAARRRSTDSWSALLTPSAPMTALFREQFDYTGEVIEEGFPRNDALVGTTAVEQRRTARERLGLDSSSGSRTAILYAPTWREHLATRHRAAASADLLDVDELASVLGDDYVLLFRGHRFHAPTGGGGRVIDVTAYPEIDDLVLASDAAILDYSSLRFDYALTGRPMVFLVPDLDDYETRLRGFLVPFADSAPGPWVATTAEVAAHLRDLPALSASYAEPIAAFNARWNAMADGHVTTRVVDHLERIAIG